jgi:hypothetical protein
MWNIIGNTANPAACIVDCTSTVGSSYVPGSQAGSCFGTQGPITMQIQGFSMKSYSNNVSNLGGNCYLVNNFYTAPTYGSAVIGSEAGCNCNISGTANQFSATNVCQSLFRSVTGSQTTIGGQSIFGNTPVGFNIVGTPTFSVGTAWAADNGTINFNSAMTTFTGGVPVGPQYICQTAGGIVFESGGTTGFPGTQPGQVTSPGWVGSL